MFHSSELWFLCDNAPSFQDNPMLCLRSEIKYDQCVIETNQRLAYQGVSNNCKDVGITKTELQEAQAPLNPSIRRPEMEGWERKRKYFGKVPAGIVQRTFKHTTRIGTLPPSTHLQRQFKPPDPALNLHRRNKADTTDQIFAKVSAIDGEWRN